MLPGGDDSAPGSAQPDALRQMIQQVLRAGQQKTLPQPVPAPAGTPRSGEVPGYMQGQGWGFERFATQVGSMVQNAAVQHKQKQLAQAESDWNQLASAIQSNNQTALNAILTDPKKLKNMAKALNQDWLNPEKTTVYKQALENVLKQQQAKGQAASKLQQMVKHLIGRATQPQMNQQQLQQMGQEIMRKAPITQGQTDPTSISKMMQSESEVLNAQASLTRAQTEARQKYDIKISGSGQLVAVDKTNPTQSVLVTTSEGSPITGQIKGANIGKPAMVNGLPIGIYGVRDGQGVVKHPGDPDWTGADAKTWAETKSSYAAGEASKDHRIQLAAQSRALAYMQSREYPSIDAQGYETWATAEQIQKNPRNFAPLSGAAKVEAQRAVFRDLHYTADQLADAVKGLGDEGFDATSRAQIAAVLRDNDPYSALSTFLASSAAETLNDAQINFVTASVAATEGAMMLRQVGSMGNASDMLRSAIIKMIPSAGTPSMKYANRQLELYTGQINRLEKGVPKIPQAPDAQGKDADPLDILQ
jgi:hypothetical protein